MKTEGRFIWRCIDVDVAGPCLICLTSGSAVTAHSHTVQGELSAGRAVPGGSQVGRGRAVAELPSLSPQGWRTAGTCPRCARTSRRWSTTASCPPTDPPAPPPASPRRSGASTRRTRRSVTRPLNVPAWAPHAAVLGREPPAVGPKKH